MIEKGEKTNRKKHIRKIFSLFVTFSVLLSICLPTYALSYADSNGMDKISADLYAVADQKDGKYCVAIWLNDILC